MTFFQIIKKPFPWIQIIGSAMGEMDPLGLQGLNTINGVDSLTLVIIARRRDDEAGVVGELRSQRVTGEYRR